MAERTLYTFGPRPTRGIMLGLGAAQLTALAAGGVIGLAMMLAKVNLLIAVLPILVAGLYTWMPVGPSRP